MTDDEGISAIGRDPDALETFYRAHVDAVQQYVARRVTTPQDAADLTADVFVAAIDASRRYRGEAAHPRAWIYGIARRVVAGHRRSRAQAARAVSRLQGHALLDDDAILRLTQRIDSEREARALLRRIAGLPSSQRDVVELVAVDGLSLVEAAAALGIRPGAARVRYHRARASLGLTEPISTCREVTP